MEQNVLQGFSPFRRSNVLRVLAVVAAVLLINIPAYPSLKIYSPKRPPPVDASSIVDSSGDILPYVHLVNSSDTDSYMPPEVPGVTSILFQNQTTFFVSSAKQSLTFQCEAKYPVFWNLAHSRLDPSVYNILRVVSIRQFSDPFDPSTFKYVTRLTLSSPSPKLTGKYSCQNAARHEIQSTVNVFWESGGGNVLVYSRQNLTAVQIADKDIVLPCYVSNPDVQPTLVKLASPALPPLQPPNINKVAPGNVHVKGVPGPPVGTSPPLQPPKDDEIHLNESVLFSPIEGFILRNLPNPLGTYKCSVDKNDYLFVNVVKNNVSSSPVSGADPKYRFEYDEDKKRVSCCNNLGRRPPTITMKICQHPSTCGLREYIFSDLTDWYMNNQGRRNGECSVLSLHKFHTGVIRCQADGGFNMFKEFIAPVRIDRLLWNPKRNTTTYFRWEEIDPQEMIAVSTPSRRDYFYDLNLEGGTAGSQRKLQNDQTIYSKQMIQLQCHTSRYYFASGNYWMVRWRNQTLSQLDVDTGLGNANAQINRMYIYQEQHTHADTVSFVAHPDMESVLCLAPVWNSSVWITKIHYLYVNESLSPLLLGGDTNEIVHYTWYANETDKVLNCSASGAPTPSFVWQKDNVTIGANAHNLNVFTPNVTTANDPTTTTTTEATTTTTTTASSATSSSLDGDAGDDGEDNQKDDNNNNSKRQNIPRKVSHSALRVSRVSYSTQGVFRCTATNFGGTVTKEYHITVLEAKSWTATVFFVLSMALTVVLMIGIFYLLRKLHKDRQEINQLSGSAVNFQNGGAIRNNTTESSSGGSVGMSASSSAAAVISSSSVGYRQYQNDDDLFQNSMGFDNGKMTNNLIDIK